MKYALALALVLLPAFALGQANPQPKVVDKKFVAAVAGFCGSATFDAATTIRNLNHGYSEQNLILGKYPSNAAVIGFGAGQCGAMGAGTYFLKRTVQRHQQNKLWWMAVPFIFTAEHISFGAYNAAIYSPRYPVVRR
jgi:hypothetical protein